MGMRCLPRTVLFLVCPKPLPVTFFATKSSIEPKLETKCPWLKPSTSPSDLG